MEDLYITPPNPFELEKQAAETVLPEDQSVWAQEITQAAFKAAPFITDYEVNTVLDRVDAERGYAFGHVEVTSKSEVGSPASSQQMEQAGVRRARIPVIVKDKKLQPLDLLVTEQSTMVPLTKRRLREAMFRPQMFDTTGKGPGDMSMVGQLFPPFRQNMGLGGSSQAMSMGKEGSEKTAAGFHTEFGSELSPSELFDRVVMADYRHGAAGLESTSRVEQGNLEERLMKVAAEQAPVKPELADRLSKVLGVPKDKLPPKITHAQEKTSGVPNANLFKRATTTIKDVTRGRVKKASLLAEILPMASSNDIASLRDSILRDGVKEAYVRNAQATTPALEKIANAAPIGADKIAAAVRLPPQVAQISRLEEGGYEVKTANAALWDPRTEEISRRELISRFGEKVALEVDQSGAMTMSEEGVSENNPELQPVLVETFGLYRVQDLDGNFLIGHVFPNLFDAGGKRVPLALFTNGSAVAVQGEIVGEPSGKSSALPFGKPSGVGVFVRVLPNGSAESTVPFEIQGSASQPGQDKKMMATAYDGQQLSIALQPNIAEPVAEGDTLLLPESFQWMSLGEATSVALQGDPSSYNAPNEAKNKVATVVVRGDPRMQSFSMDGYPVMAIPKQRRQQMTLDDTMFVLGGMGSNLKYAMQKIAYACSHGMPAEIRISRHLRPMEQAKEAALQKHAGVRNPLYNLRRDLVKEAALLPDPNSVDAVLSLGLLTPDNLENFVTYLPNFDRTVNQMCELLLGSRLGLEEIPTAAIEKMVRCTEDVIEGLRSLAFQQA